MLTATDNTTELDISELVDMEKQPGCEHSEHNGRGRYGHSGPAWGVIRFRPQCSCRNAKTFLICQGAYEYAVRAGVVRCGVCGHRHPTHEVWTLVSVL